MNHCKFLGILFVSGFFVTISCSSKNTNHLHHTVFIKSMNEDLDSMNLSISSATEMELRDLEEKRYNLETSTKANIWFHWATLARRYEGRVNKYIESIRVELDKKSAGDNGESVMNEFLDNDAGTLYDTLSAYKRKLLALDTLLYQGFYQMPIFQTDFDRLNQNRDFKSWFFDDVEVTEAILILRHFENNVSRLANSVIRFCNAQAGPRNIWQHYYRIPIVSQSSTIIRKGESLEITAGMGEFSKRQQPNITIDGKKTRIDAEGIAVYKLPKATVPGIHFARIRVEFTDQDGKRTIAQKSVKYTVID